MYGIGHRLVVLFSRFITILYLKQRKTSVHSAQARKATISNMPGRNSIALFQSKGAFFGQALHGVEYETHLIRYH